MNYFKFNYDFHDDFNARYDDVYILCYVNDDCEAYYFYSIEYIL